MKKILLGCFLLTASITIFADSNVLSTLDQLELNFQQLEAEEKAMYEKRKSEAEEAQRTLENGTRVFLYAKTDRIVWEAKDGRHYTDSIPYESKRLFYELRYMDICRKYANSLNRSKAFEEEEELTLEIVKEKGLENFPEDEIQVLCSKMIRETNYENDDFLTYVCYDLFKNDVQGIHLTLQAAFRSKGLL